MGNNNEIKIGDINTGDSANIKIKMNISETHTYSQEATQCLEVLKELKNAVESLNQVKEDEFTKEMALEEIGKLENEIKSRNADKGKIEKALGRTNSLLKSFESIAGTVKNTFSVINTFAGALL